MPPNHDEFLRRFTAAQPLLRRFVLAHLPDFHQAEDALQEISLVLWRKFDDFRQGASFAAWALGVARNELLHARRGVARERLLFTDELAARAAERLDAAEPDAAPRRAWLARCLEQLAGRARRAVELKYAENLPTGRLAAALGTTEAAVRVLLCRARRALADCLDRARRAAATGKESA